MSRSLLFAASIFLLWAAPAAAESELLWGDTHLHTSNSFDAYLNRNLTADPDTAYRYAKGQPVVHPGHRARVQIETPLDFLVVSDHAEYLGVIKHVVERGVPREGLGFGQRLVAWYAERRLRGVMEDESGRAAFTSLLPDTNDVEAAAANPPEIPIPNAQLMSRTIWQEIIATADAHNDPRALLGDHWLGVEFDPRRRKLASGRIHRRRRECRGRIPSVGLFRQHVPGRPLELARRDVRCDRR